LEKQALASVMELLSTEDFYIAQHRELFEVLRGMFQADKPVEILTVSETLTNLGLFDKLGGQAFLASLIDQVPTTANVEYHSEIVKEKGIQRRLIEVGAHIVRLGYSSDMEITEMLNEAERLIFEVSQRRNTAHVLSLRDILGPAFAHIEERYRSPEADVSGAPTGFYELDRMLGGFQQGSLYILAARPSMGKTSLALNMAQFSGEEEKNAVLIYSLEMSSNQLVLRMLGSQAQIDIQDLRRGAFSRSQWDQLVAASGKLARCPLYIDDGSMLTTLDFRARCRRFKLKHPNVRLIVVDYLQLMSHPGRNADSKQQEVAEISRTLKAVARDLECAVLAISQLSRGVESRQEKTPVLSDLRDSGAIEQDADVVMLLYRPDYYQGVQDEDSDSEAFLDIAKNRNGPTGKISLLFRRRHTRFVNPVQAQYQR
jgi:replicative DNA helicase